MGDVLVFEASPPPPPVGGCVTGKPKENIAVGQRSSTESARLLESALHHVQMLELPGPSVITRRNGLGHWTGGHVQCDRLPAENDVLQGVPFIVCTQIL